VSSHATTLQGRPAPPQPDRLRPDRRRLRQGGGVIRVGDPGLQHHIQTRRTTCSSPTPPKRRRSGPSSSGTWSWAPSTWSARS
jgi:hypothetical protein